MACSESMKHDGHVCQPCQTEGTLVPAAVWCNSCKEFICTGCINHHRKFAALKHHQLVPIEDMPKLELVKEFKSKCDTHQGKKIKYFCQNHDELGCSQCFVSKHRSCKTVLCLTDVVTCKTDEYKKLCDAISRLHKGFVLDKQIVSGNIEFISTQNNDKIKRLEQVGQSLKHFIDTLVEKKKQEATESMSNDTERMEMLSVELADAIKQCQHFEEVLRINYIDNVQLFITMKHIQKNVKDFGHKFKTERQNYVAKYDFVIDALLSMVFHTVTDLGTFATLDGNVVNKEEKQKLQDVRLYKKTSSGLQWSLSVPGTFKSTWMRAPLPIIYTVTVSCNKDIHVMHILLYSFADIETDVALTIQSIEGTKIQCSSHHRITTGEIVHVPLKRENGIDGLSMAKNVDYTINVRVSSNTRLPSGYKRFTGNDFQTSVVAHGVGFTFSKQEQPYCDLIAGLQFIPCPFQL